MKCQKCTKAATLHITEILSEEQVEELHLCEECAQKYLYEPQQKQTGDKTVPAGHGEEAGRAGRPEPRMSTFAASSSSISATPAGSAVPTTTRSSATS